MKKIICLIFLLVCLFSLISKAETHCPPAWTDELEENSNCPKLEYIPLKYNRCWEYGKKDGLECIYQENGKLLVEQNWKNGHVHGLKIEYFENGNIEFIKTYDNDNLSGLFKQYYESGNLFFEGYREGDCTLKYGTCYTKDGIAVPLKGDDLRRACYNMLCLDAIKRNDKGG